MKEGEKFQPDFESGEKPPSQEFWRPLEEKNYPDYIKERFQALNEIHGLDLPAIQEILEKPEFNEKRTDIIFYLGYRLGQEAKNPSFSEEQKSEFLLFFQGLAEGEVTDQAGLDVCDAAISAVGNLGEPALPFLQKLAEGGERMGARTRAVLALGNVGEPALPILQKLSEDSEDKNWPVRVEVVKSLGMLGESALPLLKELAKDKNKWVKDAAVQGQSRIKLFSKVDRRQLLHDLVASQEPSLLNPLAKEALYDPDNEKEGSLLKLNDIITGLKEKYPELAGLVILGSLSKGYWTSNSDLDWGLVFESEQKTKKERTREIRGDFSRLAEENAFNLCTHGDHSLDTFNIDLADDASLEIVFNGLFFGDRKRLFKVQEKILENIDKERWHEIQGIWKDQLFNYRKAVERFGFKPNEAELIKRLRNFLWSLPDFKTMKDEVRRRNSEAGLALE